MHGRSVMEGLQDFQVAEYWKDYKLDDLLAILDGKIQVLPEMRHAAYLALIGYEPIEQRFLIPHLQKYAASMDFAYRDARGTAFSYAASLGKDEILNWLRSNVVNFHHILPDERSNIIFSVVANCRLETLALLVRPESEKGFGWSLDVRDANGKSPAIIAAQKGVNYFLERLLTPKEQGGFGLVMEQGILDEIKMNHPEAQALNDDVTITRGELTKSSVGIKNEIKLNEVAIFTPAGFVEQGSMGVPRFFAVEGAPWKKLIVKRAPEDYHFLPAVSVCHIAGQLFNDLWFSRLAYPQYSQDRVNAYYDDRGFDFRHVRRFRPGKSLFSRIVTLKSCDELAMMLLSVFLELQRLHEKTKIIHGNLRAEDIIINEHTEMEYGLVTYQAFVLNFYLSARIGMINATLKGAGDGFAPEVRSSKITFAAPAQDIYRFAFSLNEALKRLKTSNPRKFGDLEKQYPSIIEFCKMGLSDSPENRPKIAEILVSLNDDLLRRVAERADESVSLASSLSNLWNNYSAPITGAAVVGTAALAIWRMQQVRK